MKDIKKQRQYYAEIASCYDEMCAFDKYDEHYFATAALRGLLELYEIKSLLDIGCGTGRSLEYLRNSSPDIEYMGLEPVEQLREQCIDKGFSDDAIFAGDACNIDLPDSSIDCVCMFGVLHHIPNPEAAINEALRIASKMVFISDHNIYGMGSSLSKSIKQLFRLLGLRRALAFLMTRGKGYHDTDWDGIFYPFSLLDYFSQIEKNTSNIYTLSTKTPAVNLLRNASHVAIVAVK